MAMPLHPCTRLGRQWDLAIEPEALLTWSTANESNHEWKCEVCHGVGCTKSARIKNPPNVLVVNLSRRPSCGDFDVVDRYVRFGDTFNLRPYMSDAGSPCIYLLYAVIAHRQVHDGLGHYVAYVRDAGSNWHCLDDGEVTQVTFRHVQRQKAYLLLYQSQRILPPKFDVPDEVPSPAPRMPTSPCVQLDEVPSPAPRMPTSPCVQQDEVPSPFPRVAETRRAHREPARSKGATTQSGITTRSRAKASGDYKFEALHFAPRAIRPASDPTSSISRSTPSKTKRVAADFGISTPPKKRRGGSLDAVPRVTGRARDPTSGISCGTPARTKRAAAELDSRTPPKKCRGVSLDAATVVARAPQSTAPYASGPSKPSKPSKPSNDVVPTVHGYFTRSRTKQLAETGDPDGYTFSFLHFPPRLKEKSGQR